MRIQEIDYEGGGRRMVGQLAVDEYRLGLRLAVLLCHEGLGLEEYVKGRSIRLAGLGYLAFAIAYQRQGEGQGRVTTLAIPAMELRTEQTVRTDIRSPRREHPAERGVAPVDSTGK